MTVTGRLLCVGLLGITSVLYFGSLAATPLIDPSEGLHAETAREMLASGDWITPRFNGVRNLDKPPVFYWLMALNFRVLGPSEFAGRLWQVVAAMFLTGLLVLVGSWLYSERAGLIAGAAFALNPGVFLYARIIKPDLPFILCIMVALTGFIVAYVRGTRWPLVTFYFSLGLAALTKASSGPSGRWWRSRHSSRGRASCDRSPAGGRSLASRCSWRCPSPGTSSWRRGTPGFSGTRSWTTTS